LKRVIKYIATLGFIGYIPVAPGTFGTAAAVLFFIIFKPSIIDNIILLLFIIPLGIIASGKAETMLQERDSRHIVIDEVGGFSLSVLTLPANLKTYILAFFLFRFFDVLKPPPIRYLEKKVPGGAGVMLDDMLAGIYTNIIIQLWNLIH
jgi:phosphatidylglycerophosphatase A